VPGGGGTNNPGERKKFQEAAAALPPTHRAYAPEANGVQGRSPWTAVILPGPVEPAKF